MVFTLKNTFYLCGRYGEVYLLYVVGVIPYPRWMFLRDFTDCYKVENVDTQHHPEKWHTLSEKFLNHYEAGIQCESYDNQTDDVSIGNNFSFRCNSPSKILRNNTASIIERIVKSLKILLPEEKTTSFSFSINPFNFSYRYYIYTLRRILI